VEAALAQLTAQFAEIVRWVKILTGVITASLFVGFAVLYQVWRVKRWQIEHGPPLERLAAEQRGRAAHGRVVAARRPHHSGTSETPH
jgi:hypothetical protein